MVAVDHGHKANITSLKFLIKLVYKGQKGGYLGFSNAIEVLTIPFDGLVVR